MTSASDTTDNGPNRSADTSADDVILVDARDRAVGTMAKLEAHRRGVLHRAVSVFVRDSRGRLLLQQRAPGKYHSGGLWTNACCSHPQPGESTSDVRFRELDRDHDGLIEHSEWTGDWESFLVLDENRDGSVGLYEYLRTRPLDRRFALLDHDRSGTLSKEEWHGDPALFTRLDRDRNGRLSRNEFPN